MLHLTNHCPDSDAVISCIFPMLNNRRRGPHALRNTGIKSSMGKNSMTRRLDPSLRCADRASRVARLLAPLRYRECHFSVPQRQVLPRTEPLRGDVFEPGRFPVFNMESPGGRYCGLASDRGEGFTIGKYYHLGQQVSDPNHMDPGCLPIYCPETSGRQKGRRWSCQSAPLQPLSCWHCDFRTVHPEPSCYRYPSWTSGTQRSGRASIQMARHRRC